MAAKPRSNLPFGMSPFTLTVVGLVLLAVIAYLVYPYIFPQKAKTDNLVVNPPNRDQAPPPTRNQGAKQEAPGDRVADEAIDNPLASFLVEFGRSNPFAAYAAMPRRTVTAAGSSSEASILNDLRRRMQSIIANSTPSETNPTPSPSPSSSSSSAVVAGSPSEKANQDKLVLTGIIKSGSIALASIRVNNEAYQVFAGERLGKTPYVLREVREDSVELVTGTETIVLKLGGDKR